MKKKSLTVAACFGMAIVVLVLWLTTRPKPLGNINHSFSSSKPATDTSTISFFAQEGENLRFYLASDISQGDLDILLYDSEGNLVKELDQAKEMVAYLTMHYADTYTLAAEYKDFAGSFKAEVYKVD